MIIQIKRRKLHKYFTAIKHFEQIHSVSDLTRIFNCMLFNMYTINI